MTTQKQPTQRARELADATSVPVSGPPPQGAFLGPVEQTTMTTPAAQAEHERELARNKADRELLELRHQLHLKRVGFYAVLFGFVVAIVACLVAAFWGADATTRTWGQAGLMVPVTGLLSFIGGRLLK